MAERQQIKKPAPQEREAQTPHSEGAEQADLSDTDALLDEIDDLLNEVGLDTLVNFRQKGGQ